MSGARVTSVASVTIVAAAMAVIAAGLIQDTPPLNWSRDELLAAAIWSAGPGAVLALLARSRWWPAVACLVLVAGFAISFGPAALAAGSLTIFASLALGSIFLARDPDRPLESALLAGVLGLGLIATAISWTARAPVHFDFLYALGLVAIVVARRSVCIRFLEDVRVLVAPPQEASDRTFNRLVGALLIALFLYAAGSGAIPEAGPDAMTSHYALLHKLKAHGSWSYDPTEVRFTLMPKLAVWAHAPFFVLGGEMAMRAVNLLALAAIGGLVAARLTPALPRWTSGLLVASFLSMPLTIWMATMLSEDPVSTLFFTAAIVAFLRVWDQRLAVDSARLDALLWSTALNLAKNKLRWRALWRFGEIAVDAPAELRDGPLVQAQLRQREQALRQVLDGFDRDSRNLVLLSECAGLTTEELVAVFGWPAGTVASRKHRALARLREELQALGIDAMPGATHLESAS